MTTSTHSKRRLTIVAAVVGAMTVLVPVGQAQSPDAFERALRNHQTQQQSFVGSPDAIDRALAAREAQKLEAIDARERGMTERPSASTRTTYAPDAFERAVVTYTDAMNGQKISMLDARERALSERPTVSSTVSMTGSEGFDWGDFGIGAGAAIGLVLIAGLGALAIRRSQSRVTTA